MGTVTLYQIQLVLITLLMQPTDLVSVPVEY